MAGIALAFSIGATYAAEDKIDPEILEMTVAEWGRLNLFVRGEHIDLYATDFSFNSEQRLAFHACLIGAAAHPQTRHWTFRRAARQCVMHARSQ